MVSGGQVVVSVEWYCCTQEFTFTSFPDELGPPGGWVLMISKPIVCRTIQVRGVGRW